MTEVASVLLSCDRSGVLTLDLGNDSVVPIVLLFFLLLRLCATGANFRLDVPPKVVARITGGEKSLS